MNVLAVPTEIGKELWVKASDKRPECKCKCTVEVKRQTILTPVRVSEREEGGVTLYNKVRKTWVVTEERMSNE